MSTSSQAASTEKATPHFDPKEKLVSVDSHVLYTDDWVTARLPERLPRIANACAAAGDLRTHQLVDVDRIGRRFFFCQQEAIETVIYFYEVQKRRRMPETGDLVRYALKLATGTGKTVVMALLVTWSTLHKHKVSGSSLYFSGPDGERLELIRDPLGEMYGTAVL